MKKNILMVMLSMVVFTTSAQQLSSGDYTVSISKITNSNISGKMIDNNFNGS